METVNGNDAAIGAAATAKSPLSILAANTATRHLVQELVSNLKQTNAAPEIASLSDFTSDVLLEAGLAALDSFLQANVTGPVLPSPAVATVERHFVEAWAGRQQQDHEKSAPVLGEIRKKCLKSLEVDGVAPYAYIPYLELFSLARHVLTTRWSAQSTDVIQLPTPASTTEATRQSISWSKLRLRIWHYKLLSQPSLGPGSNFTRSSQWSDVPTLADEIIGGIESVRKQVIGDEVWAADDTWSQEDRTMFLLEAANSYILLGRSDQAKSMLKEAAQTSGLLHTLSGALGKRTKFQENSTSQLVVLARSREQQSVAAGCDEQDDKEEAVRPDALKLNDDTLLEEIHYTKEQDNDESAPATIPKALADIAPDDQPQLSPLDQVILLTEATIKDAFSPADTLTSEEVLPFAVRVLSDKSTNWQIYTQALLVRSRIEVHRSRTVERGVLQLQAVADQVLADTTSQPAPESNTSTTDVPVIQVTAADRQMAAPVNADKPTSFLPAPKPSESAPAEVRLRYIHALSTPPRWHLESELAYAWAGVGSLTSALEIFKRLRLWAEVALCLASTAAVDDEDGRGSGGDDKARGILRWRLFHRTAETSTASSDPDDDDVGDPMFLKAADFSGPERSPPPPNAPRLWCILGELEDDPEHYERAWEVSQQRFARAQKSLGEYYLKQKDLEKARTAYKLATSVNRMSPEMWSRLGDINLRLAQFEDAAEAFSRSISSANDTVGGEDARTWSNLGSALWSLYCEVTAPRTQGEKPAPKEVTQEDDEELPLNPEPDARDPSTLLAKSLAAYKKGASIAHDNWRIWDNVLTLASRVQPPAVAEMVLALKHILRIRHSEDAIDADVLAALLQDATLAKEKDGSGAGGGIYEPPRGSEERLVARLVEEEVVPLITRRAELWTLVSRLRAWRRDYAGAVEAAERAWRAATGSASSGLLPGSAADESRDWTVNLQAWGDVVRRTDELVSALENWGPEDKWRGKARSAVRSVMGKGKEAWQGNEGWKTLEGLMEGLKPAK